MQVSVQFATQIRTVAGLSNQVVDLPEPTSLHSFIRSLVEEHGEPLRSLLVDEACHLRPSVLVSLNNEQVPGDQDGELHDGDELLLMSAISGG